MSHYDKEINANDEAVQKEIRRQIKLLINKLTAEELEFAFMIIAHIKDFKTSVEIMKMLNR